MILEPAPEPSMTPPAPTLRFTPNGSNTIPSAVEGAQPYCSASNRSCRATSSSDSCPGVSGGAPCITRDGIPT
jgi:hypothetical protein